MNVYFKEDCEKKGKNDKKTIEMSLNLPLGKSCVGIIYFEVKMILRKQRKFTEHVSRPVINE